MHKPSMGKRPRTEDQEEPDRRKTHERALFQCARLILPLLHPPELAATSSTCKTLHRIAKSVTAGRTSDASGGLEKLPIPFANAVDGQPYASFAYAPTQTLGSGQRRTQPVFDAPGCECERCDGDAGCPCGGDYLDSGELARECGPSCRCGVECGNRVTQGGVSVRLRVVKDERKGWGLRAGQLIRRGQFVCEYAGELLTTKEARRRQQIYDQLTSGGWFCSALLVVREHLPSGKACMRINIDATRIGNVARFINHSCDGGNLSTVLMRSSGALLPRLCFFASRDIEEDEEITFSYGEIRLKSKGLQCFCGSSSCFGVLPSEST
ncbi:hypothetical protein RHMOL_Rhmol03G0055400 [Rhododendron molle]|uniref:Uncharacterized protein n=2 Tax=Rhododendron molle TaxID=49168 RepID=A0ACC0PC00_RHOML|nr:hypothetical protein RHMOL_Rhmol03G0055400 [Rhododendron molle]KAI8562709.1 hypothetical protein RHMOL_Rhmol03G0055400 [Rhododendron molle]